MKTNIYSLSYPMRLKNKAGFTLIEILVVMALIALMASLVAPKLFNKLGSSKVKVAIAQVEMIEIALDAFRLDVGRYPTTDEGLQILWLDSGTLKSWDGLYLPKPIKGDPWGAAYEYKAPGTSAHPFDLSSLGADGKVGGAGENADISIWD